jgi:iron complex outermembrane receptor protein
VAWDVSVYRARLDGELLQFTVDPDIPASTFNAERTVHQGIEAGLDVTLLEGILPAGAEPDQLVLRQVYQFNDFRFRNDAQYGDNRLPAVQEHLYRAELRYSRPGFTIAPSVEWVPRGAWADYRNTLRTVGYATLGLQASATLSGGVELFADVRNLTGRKAVGDLSAVVAATASSAIYYPIDGRAFFAGLRASF